MTSDPGMAGPPPPAQKCCGGGKPPPPWAVLCRRLWRASRASEGKHCEQKGHAKGLKHGLLGWLQCFSSCCLVVKPFSHEAHRYGRSPVCVRTCRTIVVVYTVEYEQNWHTSRGARGSGGAC